MNAVEIEQAISDLCEAPFDREEFPFQFLEAFGEKTTTITRLRKGSTNQTDLPGGLLQRNNIHLLVSEPGAAGDDLRRLAESPATGKHKAKFALATDGSWVEAENLVDGETLACSLTDLQDHFGFFLALAGIATVKQIRDNAFDIKATARMNRLYVELQRNNPDWDTKERREELNHFFARLIFCFFAEDTGIFPQDDLFTGTVQQMSDSDGSNTHEIIGEIFRAMNIPREERDDASLPRYAASMPYVNGGLFEGSTKCPKFTKIARSYFIHIGGLDWTKINPDIFGSMIQAVAEDEERGELGMHYTSVPNILKVLNPLFLDELRQQLEDAADNKRKLLNLRNRMARIRVFDPACGSGNFLVVAYKEMRAIEAKINRRRGEPDRASDIPLTNFRGIEIRSFAAEVARLALVIARFQCDLEYRGRQLALTDALPLSNTNWITCGNALRLNWAELCPPSSTRPRISSDDLFETPSGQAEVDFENEGDEMFICGNPPYQGSVNQTESQKAEMKAVFDSSDRKYKDLDYVAAFVYKAALIAGSTSATCGLVTTNSITQGEQVGMLWPRIFNCGTQIHFAHRSFLWSNLAKDAAGVVCVVIGLRRRNNHSCRIFDKDSEQTLPTIGPYLHGKDETIVHPRRSQIHRRPSVSKGNSPTDDGNLILSRTEYKDLAAADPAAIHYLRRYIGAHEFLRGTCRYCIWIAPNDEQAARENNKIHIRLDAVATFRRQCRGNQARNNADKPHRFVYAPHRDTPFVMLPRHVSSNREFFTVDLLDGDTTIAADSASVIYDASLVEVAILNSRLHLAWLATIGGRIKSDFRYSGTLVWNTFPIPDLTTENHRELTASAANILTCREAYWPATLADMYDPNRMDSEFPRVREAHEHNDEILERIYIGRRFKNDTERLEKLFEMYAAATEKEASP